MQDLTHGCCTLSHIPLRASGSHRSEMVSQLLFGESYRVLAATEEWLEVETDFDHYRGFLAANQHYGLSEADCPIRQDIPLTCALEPLRLRCENNGLRLTVPPSAALPLDKENRIRIGKLVFTLESDLRPLRLPDILANYTNAPYLWGGRTPWGMDCSGFTQAVYKTQGIALPRDASMQALLGKEIPLAQARFGDLAFFRNENGRITHTGWMLSPDRILHCSGRVREDRIDEKGIVRIPDDVRTHTLHCIKHIADLS
ncbi:MAG: C40 family peptidase [Bacteroidales bacterium]|nr:C40 family peptidase [Bacteroidales bacterium]